MKKGLFLCATIGLMSLSSCSLFKTYTTVEKTLEFFSLDTAVKNKDQIIGNSGTTKALFIENEDYIPYFTLEQYASFYEPYLKKGAKSEITNDGATSMWTITMGEQLYFVTAISGTEKMVVKGGEISNALDESFFTRDTKGLSYRTKYESDYVALGTSNIATYDFSDYNIKRFRKDGIFYYPLGFLDVTYSDSSNTYFFYNYNKIYYSQDAENFSEAFKDASGNLTTVEDEMASITQGAQIPKYLIDFNANVFLYTMENFYGMKDSYEISSMKSFYQRNRLYNNLFSSDNSVRGDAYSSALAVFDDNHTVFVSAGKAWGEDKTIRYGGPKMMKRSALKTKLLELKTSTRATYFNNPNYDYNKADSDETVFSNSGKTAMFSFDSFKFGTSEELFYDDGTLKSDAYKYDTYFMFINRFLTYESLGVENVIIDISTNGGGVVGVMARLLALLSKENSTSIFFLDSSVGGVSINNVKVDVNGDGEYQSNETFGNKFNFFILTSDCSYSCGNAFPCYAQQMGIKIIGEKSGGGECAVAVHYMPNTEYVYHSSNLHLGFFNRTNKYFDGFERGATPDISLVPANHTSLFEENGTNDYTNNIPSNFYDIEHLESLISAK